MTEYDFFPLMGWSHNKWLARPRQIEEDLKEVAECGLNLICFAEVEELDLCQKYGLKAIIIDPRLQYNWAGTIDKEKMEKNMDSLMKEVGDHSALYGYFLTDEPRPKTYMQEYANLALVAKALRNRTPNKLPYVNLLPGRAFDLKTDEYERYIRTYIDTLNASFLSYDNYSLYEDGSLHYSYFDNLEVMRRFSLEYDIPFWHIILSVSHFTYRELTEADMHFQVYTSLAYGAKGISYFTYHSPNVGNYRNAPVDQFGHKTPLWGIVQRLNLQIKTLAPVLLKLKSKGVYHWAPRKGLVPYGCKHLPGDTLVRKVSSQVGFEEFLVGEFEHRDGTPYIMIVNTSFTNSTRFEVEVNGSYELHRVSPPFLGFLYRRSRSLWSSYSCYFILTTYFF
jgi:hypothetical protein